MAYCLVSLVEILEQILHPDQHQHSWVLDPAKVSQVQSLLEKAYFLRDGFAASERVNRDRIDSLEDRIKDVVQTAEDVLEFHVTGHVIASSGQSCMICLPDLQEVIGVFESAKEEMIEIINAGRIPDHAKDKGVDYKRRYPNPKNMVVGVAEDLNQLRNRLTGKHSSKLEIIPIVGMGGSGKTTLARILYDEFSSSKSHFDVCAWVTISQDYNPRRVLQTLLESVAGRPTSMQEIDQIIVALYQSLFSRRYFIVLDDIWSSEAWDAVQRAFPHDNKGSRVILTTRENDLGYYVQSKSHQMRLLGKEDSWDLLREKVCGEESCPSELEEIGKRIAKNCKGLPLALQVIGGLLSNAKRSKDFWEQVASDVNSCIANEDVQFLGIFSLSYAHLPHYLKPCFLYMSAFPEDYKIRASKLIRVWVAEGLLYPIRDKTLEETAVIYLKALVDRNLVFVRESNCNGKVKSYGIHDLLRDLCMKKAKENKFLCVHNLSEDTSNMRRVSVHSLHAKDKNAFSSVKLMPLTRSVLCMTIGEGPAGHEHILSYLCFDLSLLRVLDVLDIVFPIFPKEILQLVNLRYLALLCKSEFPDNISVLRNLQILIIADSAVGHFTLGMFDIPQLRHLQFSGLQYLEGFEISRCFGIQEKLQSLSSIPLIMLTQLFLGKIPNLRSLGVACFSYSTDTFDLTCFNKLENLKCSGNHHLSRRPPKLPSLVLPDSLKKLTLWWCSIPQTFMNTIGMLPNLEALKLQRVNFESLTWEPSEDEFCTLQYLQFDELNLENWLADETHFPVLQHLVIQYCYSLKEIPLEIGGIETLELIEVDERSSMAMDSARKILEEQRYMGNDLLQLRVRG